MNRVRQGKAGGEEGVFRRVELPDPRGVHPGMKKNLAIESFFKSIMAELVWRTNWQTRRDVEVALFQDINGFCNPRRRHSALARKSPVTFERKAA